MIFRVIMPMNLVRLYELLQQRGRAEFSLCGPGECWHTCQGTPRLALSSCVCSAHCVNSSEFLHSLLHTSSISAALWAHNAQCKDNLHSRQTPGNLQDLTLQYLLAHIKKDLSKISSAANQIRSTQFFAVVDPNLFCQFFLLS